MARRIRVTIWNEFIHERTEAKVAAIYPHGIHAAIAVGIGTNGFEIRIATFDQPDHGLSQETLQNTDVLIWWGHLAHEQVSDEVVERIYNRVLSGMGLIVLHSGHRSKIFKKLMGTTCDLKWRSDAERERLWVVDPSHPITEGLGEFFELPIEEMYGEFFDIPAPEELIFISWFQGGEVFRSGCTYSRGLGKIFYFRPGDQEYPTYYNKNVLRVIANGVRWAASPHGPEPVYGNTAPLEPIIHAGAAAGWQNKALRSGGITKLYVGQTPEGQDVYQYVLTNKNGMQAAIMTYGGIMTSLTVPDRNGKLEDVLLGYPSMEDYWRTGNKNYFGALIGRYANRIAGGQFTLDGVTYRLSVNDGPNTLHGGRRGFDKRVWHAKEVWSNGAVGLSLRYLSKDGEEGFPGNVDATVVYTLTDGNDLRIDYAATTDKKTVVNLTQHNYYNLSGAGKGNILGHIVRIHSDRFTPVTQGLIPTGQVQSVGGTSLDFREPTPVGARIRSDDPQMRLAGGYDFNYVINHDAQSGGFAASVHDPVSGRLMEVYTTQPAIQFYTGNRLGGSDTGKEGIAYEPYAGLTLETQHYPDSPNQPQFPSTVLVPGQLYRHATVYKFRGVHS
ncbi:trehalose utilization protein/galactose mutarotase-like enzyme [Paenibacillus harenae]|uniref:Trehalose utilization protein/galactose mutarotase-like enzyme n=1 Tax=Paenibacillus harenae TaxID=306543 RepID=A0ABT9U8G0_PAEHA|nr:trehalose utilization protein/galactose mutarotase-like enzyme [Paenibacillus harenae]